MGILLVSHYLAFLFSNMYSVGVCIFHYKLRKIWFNNRSHMQTDGQISTDG